MPTFSLRREPGARLWDLAGQLIAYAADLRSYALTMEMWLTRLPIAALALLFTFVASSQPAAAQASDLCAQPSQTCSAALPTACVTRFAAGALAASGDDCTAALNAYRACLASVAEQCGAAPQDRALEAKPPLTARAENWIRRFDGRIGKVIVANPTLYPFEVTLWHPDNRAVFGRWTVEGQSEVDLLYDDQMFNIGNDWGLQFGDAPARSVGEATEWRDGAWRASAARFFE